MIYGVVNHEEFPICDVSPGNGILSVLDVPNARLIETAPDLLSELRFAVALLKPMFGSTVQVQRMEAVIAKATGSAA